MNEILTIGRQRFRIVEQLGSGDRIRLRVREQDAGSRRRERMILALPQSRATEQHLRVLERLANARNVNVPFLITTQRQKDNIYVVTEWKPGISLADFLQSVRTGRAVRPSTFQACRLIRGQAHGLCQLHVAWDIHHGDIKPANLILSPGGKWLSTIDFGSAWLGQRAVERTSGDGVSGIYSAPELLEEGPTPDFRTDQFSLSVVWYELLTLQVPYEGAGGRAGMQRMRAAFERKLIPPSQVARHVRRGVPRGLLPLIDEVVCKGLAFDPAERFPSPRSWLDALDEIHREFRRRQRLGGFHRAVAEGITKLAKFLARGRSANQENSGQ